MSPATTVLLVEDNATVRELIRMGLEHEGFAVLEAGDGLEALSKLNRHNGTIEIVVADVVMPGMDGSALVGAMAAQGHRLPTILVSGYGAQQVEGDLPIRFLPKPYTPRKLAATIRETLTA